MFHLKLNILVREVLFEVLYGSDESIGRIYKLFDWVVFVDGGDDGYFLLLLTIVLL
jgi:hypothetical protein